AAQRAAGVDHHVPELAGEAVGPLVQAPVDHHGPADAIAELEVDRVREAAASLAGLGQTGEADVVVDDHVDAEDRGQLPRDDRFGDAAAAPGHPGRHALDRAEVQPVSRTEVL